MTMIDLRVATVADRHSPSQGERESLVYVVGSLGTSGFGRPSRASGR